MNEGLVHEQFVNIVQVSPWTASASLRTAISRLQRPPRDLAPSNIYVEFDAESDFEGPRAVRGQFRVVFGIFGFFSRGTSKSRKSL